jgi:hypothetical protein
VSVELTESAKSRFWKKVDRRGQKACWPWLGARDKDGYGVFGVSTKVKTARAHRVAWQLTNGDLGDLQVLHDCDVPECCNPNHLFLGTNHDNVRDKMAKGRHVSGMATKPERAVKGERHGNAKLTDEAVREIRRSYVPRKVTLKSLAEKFGVSVNTIHWVVKGSFWKHVRA